MRRPILYWECDRDAERLHHTTIEKAVEAYFDGSDDPIPEHVTVYGYATDRSHLPPAADLARHALYDLYERITEENDDPDGYPDEPSQAMQVAARAFVDAVLADYDPWLCEVVETITVRTREHLPASWLADPNIRFAAEAAVAT